MDCDEDKSTNPVQPSTNSSQKSKRKNRSKKKKNSAAKTEPETQLPSVDIQEPVETMNQNQPQKSREEVLAERKAKKASKKGKGDAEAAPTQSNVSNVTVAPQKPAQNTPKVVPQKSVEKKPSVDPQRVTSQQIPATKPTPATPKVTLATQVNTQPQKALPASEETKSEKSRDEILRERELKKLAKQQAKQGKGKGDSVTAPQPQQQLKKSGTDTEISEKLNQLHISEEPVNPEPQGVPQVLSNQDQTVSKVKPTTKAERRALQEAQRAKKAQTGGGGDKPQVKPTAETSKKPSTATPTKSSEVKVATKPELAVIGKSTTIPLHKVKLFNHLYTEKITFDAPINSEQIHPAIQRLGVQYAKGIIVGANARCVAFLNALKELINDYVTPQQKEFSRGLEALIKPCVVYLKRCRPMAVSMNNALRFIKYQLTQLNADDSDDAKKEVLTEAIDTYIRDQIEKASQAISIFVQEKISNGDVILIYGCSSLIKHILEAARERKVDFRVIIVDAFPRREGHEMLKRLTAQGINCTCVLISAVGFIMQEVTKVLLGAHALLANGYVMSRVGTAQIALIAKSYNVPVLVCCETHKFSERVQTDAFVYNEIGDPNELVIGEQLAQWESCQYLTPLNLYYDVTPPELVTAVVTEIAILPCTSVPVILRIKPSEIGGY